MTLASQILATLAYTDYYGAPLDLAALHTRLIKEKTTPKTLLLELAKLISAKKIGLTLGYYHLATRASIVKPYLKKRALAQKKLETIKRFVPTIAKIPGILAVYVTGSVGAGSATEADDLDLMIIAKDDMLWISRLLLTLITEVLGERRRPKENISPNKLCLNLYLTPRALSLPTSKRSLYTAYELIQAKPVFDPSGTRSALLNANSWIKQFLPNVILPQPTKTDQKAQSQLTKTVNLVLFHLQYLYMKGRLTREHVTLNSAFFHPQNPAPPELFSLTSIAPVSISLRKKRKKIVLATGFFDLLHKEHIKFLQNARALGDILIVAVESDARARKLKGEGRPIETQLDRCRKILARGLADYVVALDDNFDNPKAYESLILAARPQFYAISSHTSFQAQKQKLAGKHGCELVVVHDHNPAISTTKIISSQ